MKYLLLGLFLLSPYCSNSQRDYCRDIKLEEDRSKGIVNYHTPLVGKQGIVGITRSMDDTLATYSVYIGVTSSQPVAKGISIALQLADGTILKDEERMTTSSMTDANEYIISASMDIDDAALESLSNTPVVRITCAGVSANIHQKDALLLMKYASCLMEH